MLPETTLLTTFWLFALTQTNFLYNISRRFNLDSQMTSFAQCGLFEIYKKLFAFGCKVNIYIQKGKHSKLDNTTKLSVMLGTRHNSASLVALNSESSKAIMTLSTFFSIWKEFPGFSEETYRDPSVTQEDVHFFKIVVEIDFSGPLVSDWNAKKLFLSKESNR